MTFKAPNALLDTIVGGGVGRTKQSFAGTCGLTFLAGAYIALGGFLAIRCAAFLPISVWGSMAKEAAKRLGRPVEFKPIDWSSKEAELKSGRIDCIWNGLNITEERKKNMLFSDPYMECKQLIFIAKGSAIKGQADLKGKVVGMQSASTAEQNLENDKAFAATLKEVKKYPDCIAAMMDLEAGRLDAIITDEIVGRYYMSKKPDKFVCLPTPVGPIGDFGIGFRKDDTKLQGEVQKVLNEMKKDGTAGKISTKWFGSDILK